MRKVTNMSTVAIATPELNLGNRFSVWQAALVLGCSPDKVRQLCADHQITYEQEPGGRRKIYITREAIEEYRQRSRVHASLQRGMEGAVRRGRL
jgi:excisionase family DNA binding protein